MDGEERDIKSEFAELVSRDGEGKAEASESQPVKTDEATPPSQEEVTKTDKSSEDLASTKALPYHKDPRWIRLLNETKASKKEAEALKAKIEALERKTEASSGDVGKSQEVPAKYKRLFGEDFEAYKEWEAFQQEETKKIALAIYEERIAKEQEMKQQEEQERKKALQFAEDQFLELAEETGIDFHDPDNTERNQILDICVKYNLLDEKGLPLIRSANELRQSLYPATTDDTEEKKKIVAKTNSKTNAASSESKLFTSSKLKKMNMSQFFN